MIRLFALILLLTACTAPAATPAPEPTATPTVVSAQSVVDKLLAAGLEISGVNPGERQEGSPLPNSYDEHIEFVVAEVAPKGGQIFVCRSKTNCDALYEYFVMLKGLAGPYTYQSAGGTVVAQLNSGLTPDTAAKFQEIVEGIE